MDKNTLRVSDRVRITENYRFEDITIRKGETGTVIGFVNSKNYPTPVEVVWDKYHRGMHEQCGRCKIGHGLDVPRRYLKKTKFWTTPTDELQIVLAILGFFMLIWFLPAIIEEIIITLQALFY